MEVELSEVAVTFVGGPLGTMKERGQCEWFHCKQVHTYYPHPFESQ